MDEDKRSIQSLDHSDVMIVAEECFNSSKKRKLEAGEADLLVLPQPKHFCLEQQAESSCPSSDIEFAECSYTMEETKRNQQTSSSSVSAAEDSSYSTGSSSCGSTISSNLDQHCSKVGDKTHEYVEDLNEMDFICPEFAVEDLVLNPVGSYVLSSARWSVNNQDSEETTAKPTIDQEFEEYFSALMM